MHLHRFQKPTLTKDRIFPLVSLDLNARAMVQPKAAAGSGKPISDILLRKWLLAPSGTRTESALKNRLQIST